MAAKNTIKVVIDNKVVSLSGYESEEYLQKVASYVNNKIGELTSMGGYNRQSPDSKATLLALNIADDYFKAKLRADTMEGDLEARDQEAYDVKHDLIAAQIQIDKLKAEVAALQKEKEEIERSRRQLSQDMEDLLK